MKRPAMKSDYNYYVIGCDGTRLMPLPQWRFQLAYATSQRGWRLAYGPLRGGEVAGLVRRGKIAAGDGHSDLEEGGAASGVRQPRSPQEPVLTAQAARPLPSADAPDTAFWRT